MGSGAIRCLGLGKGHLSRTGREGFQGSQLSQDSNYKMLAEQRARGRVFRLVSSKGKAWEVGTGFGV